MEASLLPSLQRILKPKPYIKPGRIHSVMVWIIEVIHELHIAYNPGHKGEFFLQAGQLVPDPFAGACILLLNSGGNKGRSFARHPGAWRCL